MKIYQIELRNNKFPGESNREISIIARTLSEAVKKAQNYIESSKVDDFYGVKNWEIIRSELITETI